MQGFGLLIWQGVLWRFEGPWKLLQTLPSSNVVAVAVYGFCSRLQKVLTVNRHGICMTHVIPEAARIELAPLCSSLMEHFSPNAGGGSGLSLPAGDQGSTSIFNTASYMASCIQPLSKSMMCVSAAL